MNNDIKFRAWCENSGDFIMILDYLCISNKNNRRMGVDLINGYPDVTKVIDVMQYVGLKDKNGRDVYNNDIVEFIYCENSLNEKVIGKIEKDEWGCFLHK